MGLRGREARAWLRKRNDAMVVMMVFVVQLAFLTPDVDEQKFMPKRTLSHHKTLVHVMNSVAHFHSRRFVLPCTLL